MRRCEEDGGDAMGQGSQGRCVGGREDGKDEGDVSEGEEDGGDVSEGQRVRKTGEMRWKVRASEGVKDRGAASEGRRTRKMREMCRSFGRRLRQERCVGG
jgi:hypothetical protein